MNDHSHLTEVIEVPIRLRDGGDAVLKINRIKNNLHKIEGGLFHPFYTKDGSAILYILEDGNGNKMGDTKKGMSMPALLAGTKYKYSYEDNDPFNNDTNNLVSRVETSRRKKQPKGYRM